MVQINQEERGGVIRCLVEELDYGTSDIARAAGVSPAAVSQWLSGKNTPTADKLERIYQFLGRNYGGPSCRVLTIWPMMLTGRSVSQRCEEWLDYVAKCAILDNGAPPSLAQLIPLTSQVLWSHQLFAISFCKLI